MNHSRHAGLLIVLATSVGFECFLLTGCGTHRDSKPSPTEVQAFRTADPSKMPPEVRAEMQSATRQSRPPTALPK